MKQENNQKEIYDLLNDIPSDLSEYPERELTEAQFRKYRERLKQSIHNTDGGAKNKPKRPSVLRHIPVPHIPARRIPARHTPARCIPARRIPARCVPARRILARYISVCAAACILAVIALSRPEPSGEQMQASSSTSYYSLSSMLGVSGELEDYALHIDKTNALSEGSVTLNAAALDAGQLCIYSTYYYDETQEIPRLSNGSWGRDYSEAFSDTDAFLMKPKPRKTNMNPYNADYVESSQVPYIQRLSINGEEILCETESSVYASANGVLQDTATYYFSTENITFPARATVEIWKSASDKKPETTFRFVLRQENVVPDRKNVALSHTATLPDGRTVTFRRFVYNALGMRIEAELDDGEKKDEAFGPAFLESEDINGSSQIFYERTLAGNRIFFYPISVNRLYSQLATEERIELSVFMYRRRENEETAERVVLSEPLTIVL